jgi:hypothetical protein
VLLRKAETEMLTLIETLTGFAAIMLMLSLLVKTLTSVVKNQWDYYSDNLKHEVQRLALETTGKTWETLVQNPAAPDWVRHLHWERLGDELLTSAYMSWFLKQLDQNARIFDIESRLKIHIANVKYTFEMRMKNLALAAGLGLCLLCDINALTIWKSLYTDQQLRATFSGPYAEQATKLAEAQATAPGAKSGQPASDTELKNFQRGIRSFLTDISFGVGRIWQTRAVQDDSNQAQRTPLQNFAYELFGSLLTGILVSIGAPYWHDILQALSALRPDKANA